MSTEVECVTRFDEPPGSHPKWDDWKWQLKNAVKDAKQLAAIFGYSEKDTKAISEVISKYPVGITPYYLSLIKRNDPKDPIRMQCVPDPRELRSYPGIQDDPLGEEADSVLPGLVHRYPDRVLVTLTNMCPVYCRHCTRKREWCHGRWTRSAAELNKIYHYIQSHPKVRDVIISGGDPLILSTKKLESVIKTVREIPHVEIIRIGSRCPVVIPQRIDKELVSMLKRYRPIWLNTHFNHPNEITDASSEACDRVLCAGIPVNNQSVLLKGINDDLKTMKRLCHSLLKIGVRPYYLFQCDPVTGTGHLRTPINKGLDIVKGMRGYTSGLGVPAFVVDGLEGHGKVVLQPNNLVELNEERALLRGYKGKIFRYCNPSSAERDENRHNV